ncbi:hypothetical protein NicSoilB4_16790 [Arthrobacter sp. NicSoilB4]|uniref:hypothetical protein n=1 Tax=Arthrobacter sp. NicSoilB4 TaxID=2830997 RepID=UPI001CC7CE24|nr:hypothetical protein [Arthrobacter sp. NicSoilB4]BCW66916.1 hypothetical protein NicSoilB4_16790 [Arthrobacter sp. NicSoilB4]
MQSAPRITVEAPVLAVGSGPSDYEELGSHVDALRRQRGLHLTLLHIGVLADFAQDVADWTRGFTTAGEAADATVAWLEGLPVLGGFSASSGRLVLLGGGRVSGLEVDVPRHVRDFQVTLVKALHELLEGLLVDNVDDFILGSRALGYRYPRWTPHIAVGRPKARERGPWEIEPLALEFGASRIRNRQFLPAGGSGEGPRGQGTATPGAGGGQ